MPKAASECGNGKMSHPDHPSKKDFLPQLLGEQSADSLQLFQGLPQLQSHFSQGHALPKVAYIQWLIVVIWRSSYFWPIAEQLDVHFTACGGVVWGFVGPALHSIPFLPLPDPVSFPYLPQCWSLINILYPHSICLSVCFQRTHPAAFGSGNECCHWFVISAVSQNKNTFRQAFTILVLQDLNHQDRVISNFLGLRINIKGSIRKY